MSQILPTRSPAIDEIRAKLLESLMIEHLEIVDISEQHRDHAGYNPAGASHLRMVIVAPIFEGVPRVHRHKMIYSLLKREMKNGPLHALMLSTLTPKEFAILRPQGRV